MPLSRQKNKIIMANIEKFPKSFDLTTEKGLKAAGALVAGVSPLIIELVKIFLSERKERQLRQARMKKKKKKSGKENGVDEMSIIMADTKGLKINIPIDGVKIDTIIGSDNTVTMNVKYK